MWLADFRQERWVNLPPPPMHKRYIDTPCTIGLNLILLSFNPIVHGVSMVAFVHGGGGGGVLILWLRNILQKGGFYTVLVRKNSLNLELLF